MGRQLREAIQAYLDASTAAPGQPWLSATAHALEESTEKGSAAVLRGLRMWSRQYHPASPREVLELEITEMVAGENAEGDLKKLLSGWRQLDKLQLHPKFVELGEIGKWSSGWPREESEEVRQRCARRQWKHSDCWRGKSMIWKRRKP